ncbi:MAG: RNA polymerase sigma factor [Oscillospiraceae bacterium]
MLFFFVLGDAAPAHRPRQIKVDEGLIEKIGEGDMQALEALYVQTERAVYAYALSLVKRPEDTVDIVQDTFIKIRAAAHLYRPMGKPMAWIFTIARNLCMNLLRQNSVRGHADWADYDNRLDFSYIADTTDRLVLESALTVLADDERQIVMLYAISGMKHHEIARGLGVPLSTALSRYHRALKKLRVHLTEKGVTR